MKKRGDMPSRSDISENVDQKNSEMEDKEIDLDKIATDVETVRHTLESLDLGGTSECANELETAFDDTESVTIEEFEKEDENLEQIQEETQEYEGEVGDHRDSSESDLGKISDASARIDTKETTNELIKAKEAALRDIEFLADQIDRAREAREKSEEAQQELQRRIQSDN